MILNIYKKTQTTKRERKRFVVYQNDREN